MSWQPFSALKYGETWSSEQINLIPIGGSGNPYSAMAYVTYYTGEQILYPPIPPSSFYGAVGSESELINWMITNKYGIYRSDTGILSLRPQTEFPDIPYNIPSSGNGGGGLQGGGGCFIATAAYGTALHHDLDILRRFRDERLPEGITKLYYRNSPMVAQAIAPHKGLRWLVRQPLRVIVWVLERTL